MDGGRPRRIARAVALVLVALVAVALVPRDAWAWTPGTHIFLGEQVLRTLAMLPGSVADLLRAYPYDFLYGSIAADTSIAKKYAPAGRHCHSWNVGLEILDRSSDEALRAFGYGYLAHLAADVVAHNYFVPRYLVSSSRTSGLGHSYWEGRFEIHIGDGYARRARDVIMMDHSGSDGHLDKILSPTIFSTSTNRRIFRGMVFVTDSDSWQRIMQIAAENSRWDITDPEVARYMERSYDFVMDLLNRMDGSEPFALDPAGDDALRLAKEVRKQARATGMGFHVGEEAVRNFSMPETSLVYSTSNPLPLYPAARADKS